MHRVATCSVLCVGTVDLYSSGAAYFFNDMGIGAPSCTVWRRILSCESAQLSYIVAAQRIFLMIWALARLLAPCGDVFCLACTSGCVYEGMSVLMWACMHTRMYVCTRGCVCMYVYMCAYMYVCLHVLCKVV